MSCTLQVVFLFGPENSQKISLLIRSPCPLAALWSWLAALSLVSLLFHIACAPFCKSLSSIFQPSERQIVLYSPCWSVSPLIFLLLYKRLEKKKRDHDWNFNNFIFNKRFALFTWSSSCNHSYFFFQVEYMKTWFFLDLLSSLPVDYIFLVLDSGLLDTHLVSRFKLSCLINGDQKSVEKALCHHQ